MILTLTRWNGGELGKERYSRETFKASTFARKKPELVRFIRAACREDARP